MHFSVPVVAVVVVVFHFNGSTAHIPDRKSSPSSHQVKPIYDDDCKIAGILPAICIPLFLILFSFPRFSPFPITFRLREQEIIAGADCPFCCYSKRYKTSLMFDIINQKEKEERMR